MNIPPEIIIIFFLISFLIYTMPTLLVKFSSTLKGKLLLLVLTVVMTIYNRTAGLLMAMLIIFLAEFNYEFNNGIIYEGFEGLNDDTTKAYDIISENPLAKDKKDQLTIEASLQPISGNIEVIANASLSLYD
jgi:hypothetical protein